MLPPRLGGLRPGLTGLARVYLPRHASHRRKFRYDGCSVRNRTLQRDLELIVRSIGISLRGAGPDVGENEGT